MKNELVASYLLLMTITCAWIWAAPLAWNSTLKWNLAVASDDGLEGWDESEIRQISDTKWNASMIQMTFRHWLGSETLFTERNMMDVTLKQRTVNAVSVSQPSNIYQDLNFAINHHSLTDWNWPRVEIITK